MSETKELDLQKIVDFVQILKNMYVMVVDSGGVHLTVPEILLAVNTFHAAVVMNIAAGGDGRPAMTTAETDTFFANAVAMFAHELIQEG